MNNYNYLTNCIDAINKDLEPMINNALKITYATFTQHVNSEELKQLFPFYECDSRIGLTLKNDWAVRYYRSKYKNKKCYYIDHSAIEYIFVQGVKYE